MASSDKATPTWKRFEHLVARIHKTLDPELYEVLHDQDVVEPGGGSHQVDVLLKPKRGYGGPILVSCKSGGSPVGVGHVREWADVVRSTGAAAGVVVAVAGFTSDAKKLAGSPERRLTLWVPRPLTLDDFAPDEASEVQEDGSRAGYICSVNMNLEILEHRPKPATAKLDVERVGPRTGKEVQYQLSQDTRDDWYIRDEQVLPIEQIRGNLVKMELPARDTATCVVTASSIRRFS